MEDTQHVIIDSKVNQIIRSYKENDQLFYTYGVDNIIFGMIKSENFSYDTFSSVMPVGVYINGVIAVYNENTYEDFETVLNDEIEKIKKEITHSENDDIKYIALAEGSSIKDKVTEGLTAIVEQWESVNGEINIK